MFDWDAQRLDRQTDERDSNGDGKTHQENHY